MDSQKHYEKTPNKQKNQYKKILWKLNKYTNYKIM